jgi:hypothetical protein
MSEAAGNEYAQPVAQSNGAGNLRNQVAIVTGGARLHQDHVETYMRPILVWRFVSDQDSNWRSESDGIPSVVAG